MSRQSLPQITEPVIVDMTNRLWEQVASALIGQQHPQFPDYIVRCVEIDPAVITGPAQVLLHFSKEKL